MQQDNNHMDELFRQAADKYPLKSDFDQWDAVRTRLNGDDEPGAAFLFWRLPKWLLGLGLALSVIFAGYIVYEAGLHDGMAIAEKHHLPYDTAKSGKAVAEGDQSSSVSTAEAISTGLSSDKSLTSAVQLPVIANDSHQASSFHNGAGIAVYQNSGKMSAGLLPPRIADDGSQQYSRLSLTLGVAENGIDLSQKSYSGNTMTERANRNAAMATNTIAVKSNAASKKASFGFYGLAEGGISWAGAGGAFATRPTVLVGVGAGRQLQKGWAIEASLQYQRINADVPGKSFSLKKIESSMPNGMELKKVESIQQALVLPVIVRKHVAAVGAKTTFSVAAGISTQLLLNEKNDYDMMVSGTPEHMIAGYTANQLYVPAHLQVGIALETNVGAKQALRVEPFYQLPLRGTGMGEVKMQHFGVKAALVFGRKQ